MAAATQGRDTPSPEEALLGGLLAAGDPDRVREALAIARPGDIGDPLLARIAQALLDLADRGDPIDATTVHVAVSRESSVDGRRAAVRIAELMDLEATGAHALYYARLVHRGALERRERLLAARLADAGTPVELRAQAREELAQIRIEMDAPRSTDPAHFEPLHEGAYRFRVPAAAVVIEIDFLRREGSQLKGELLVRCDLPGARTYDGVLSIGDLNLSSPRTREAHAKYLAERAGAKDVDWTGLLEEFAQRVLAAERAGSPAVVLGDLQRPAPEEALEVHGFPLLRRHPSILFGDGGTAKSYLALYLAGVLAERGLRVAYIDWELAGEDHRDRLERLFGPAMPTIYYARCTRPLVYEAERLRRIVRERAIDYAVFDSVAFACDGPPEAAEVAGRYFLALRQLGEIGSLHVAHVSKAADGADQKPFGSVFWHNGARASWNVKLAEGEPGDSRITVGLYHRKANLGARLPAVGFELSFDADRTRVRRVDLADVPDLAAGLSIRQRMVAALRRGAMTREALAEEIGAKPDTVARILRRERQRFVVLDGGLVGLKEDRT